MKIANNRGENILRTDKGQITTQSMTPEDLASFKQIFQRIMLWASDHNEIKYASYSMDKPDAQDPTKVNSSHLDR